MLLTTASAVPRVFPHPAVLRDAYAQVERWLAAPRAWIPRPTDGHATLVRELLTGDGLTSRDVHDVHLAALAISHGIRIASHDTGFARFPAARWFDPLAD